MTVQTMRTWSGSPDFTREHFQDEVEAAGRAREFFMKMCDLIEEYVVKISNTEDSVTFQPLGCNIYEYEPTTTKSFREQIGVRVDSTTWAANYYMAQFVKEHGEAAAV